MIALSIVIAVIAGFVVGVLSEKKNGLVARAENGEASAIQALKDKAAKL